MKQTSAPSLSRVPRLKQAAMVLIAVVVLISLSAVSHKAFIQSSILHKCEQTRDGIDTIRINVANEWGKVAISPTHSKQDQTAEAIASGITPHDWPHSTTSLSHPFGGSVEIYRLPAKGPPHHAAKPSTRLILEGVPEGITPYLLPFLNKRMKERKVYNYIQTTTGTDKESNKDGAARTITLDIALATKAPG